MTAAMAIQHSQVQRQSKRWVRLVGRSHHRQCQQWIMAAGQAWWARLRACQPHVLRVLIPSALQHVSGGQTCVGTLAEANANLGDRASSHMVISAAHWGGRRSQRSLVPQAQGPTAVCKGNCHQRRLCLRMCLQWCLMADGTLQSLWSCQHAQPRWLWLPLHRHTCQLHLGFMRQSQCHCRPQCMNFSMPWGWLTLSCVGRMAGYCCA